MSTNTCTMDTLEQIRKLRFLPREELAEFVIELYASDDVKLKKAIKKVCAKNVTKVKSYVVNHCNIETCISLISEYGSLSEKHAKIIDKLYGEYLYGINPTLYFSQLFSPTWHDFKDMQNEIPILIQIKSEILSCEDENKYKNFRINSISKNKDVIEILFNLFKRHSIELAFYI